MSWVIELPYTSIPKGLSGNFHGHWRHRHKATLEVRALVVAKVRAERIPTMQRLQVGIVQYVADRRVRDADNAWPLLKACADALASNRGVSAHLVPDDSDAYCTKLAPRIEYAPTVTPHFALTVTDISNRPDVIEAFTRRLK